MPSQYDYPNPPRGRTPPPMPSEYSERRTSPQRKTTSNVAAVESSHKQLVKSMAEKLKTKNKISQTEEKTINSPYKKTSASPVMSTAAETVSESPTMPSQTTSPKKPVADDSMSVAMGAHGSKVSIVKK